VFVANQQQKQHKLNVGQKRTRWRTIYWLKQKQKAAAAKCSKA